MQPLPHDSSEVIHQQLQTGCSKKLDNSTSHVAWVGSSGPPTTQSQPHTKWFPSLDPWRNTWMGTPIGDNTIYMHHSANYQLLIAQDWDDIEYLPRKLIEEYENGKRN